MDYARSVTNAVGVLVGAVFSLLSSWLVADRYFGRQRRIDKDKEEMDVQLSYTKLVHAYCKMLGKESKLDVRQAMAELEAKLKIYNREFDASAFQIMAGEQAAQMIKDNPGDFEDIQS